MQPTTSLSDELISAMSALNMEPEPKAGLAPRSELETPYFLSETDAMAEHSMEHIKQAFRLFKQRSATLRTVLERHGITGMESYIIARDLQQYLEGGSI